MTKHQRCNQPDGTRDLPLVRLHPQEIRWLVAAVMADVAQLRGQGDHELADLIEARAYELAGMVR